MLSIRKLKFHHVCSAPKALLQFDQTRSKTCKNSTNTSILPFNPNYYTLYPILTIINMFYGLLSFIILLFIIIYNLLFIYSFLFIFFIVYMFFYFSLFLEERNKKLIIMENPLFLKNIRRH
jgi:hypothetical protein